MNLQQASTNLTSDDLKFPDTYSTTIIDTAPSNSMYPIFWDPTTEHTFDAGFNQQFDVYTCADLGLVPENTTDELYPDAFDDRLLLTSAAAVPANSPVVNSLTETKPPLPALPDSTNIKRQTANSNRTRKTKREPRRLRTAHRRAKATSSTHTPSIASTSLSHESNKQRNARLHNEVEKAYRARLNGHFEALLAILPSGASEEPLRQQRLSKAMVLDLARRQIRELTAELGVLRQDIAQTSEMMGLLEGEFVCERGGPNRMSS